MSFRPGRSPGAARRWGSVLNLRRVTVACLCIGALLWLYLDKGRVSQRKGLLNERIASGAIGGLTPGEQERLRRDLEWLSAAAGVNRPVLLNSPYSSSPAGGGALHVFTTRPEAVDVTHCARGNAVYDAELDTIFIDLELIKFDDWREALASPDDEAGLAIQLTPEDLPFLAVYSRFVLMHELGHRELHRRKAGLFDGERAWSRPALRRREAEADQFAIDAMERAYRIARGQGIEPIDPNIGTLIDYRVDRETPLREAIEVSLVEMARGVTLGRLMISGLESPFFEDDAHPSSLDRSLGLIRQLLRRQDLNPRLAEWTRSTAAFLERMAAIRETRSMEITSDLPLAGALFDEKGLLIFRRSSREVRRLGNDEIAAGIRKRLSVPLAGSGESLRVPDGATLFGVWASPGLGVVSLSSEGRLEVIDADWRQARLTSVRQGLAGGEFLTLRLPPQPAPTALAMSRDGRNVHRIHSFAGVRPVAAVAVPAVVEAAVRLGAPPEVRIDPASLQVALPNAYLTMTKGTEGTLLGLVALSLPDLRVRRIIRLKLPPGSSVSPDNPLLSLDGRTDRLVAIPSARRERFLVVKTTRNGQPAGKRQPGWEVWEAWPDRQPHRLAGGGFLVNPDASAPGPRISQEGLRWLPPDHLVMNWSDDSVYTLDFTKGTAQVVFHPGVANLEMSVGAQGMLALFSPGSRKIFLLAP